MLLKLLESEFAICKAPDFSQVDLNAAFIFLAKTDEECSIVCAVNQVPANSLEIEQPWRAFRIEGQLDFSLIDIIARISTMLADRGVGIFVISTYNTDYVLVKSQQLDEAIQTLKNNGYPFV